MATKHHSWCVSCEPLIPETKLDAKDQRAAKLKAILVFAEALNLVQEDLKAGLILGNLNCSQSPTEN